MFGIGFGELAVIFIVLLIAVGPNRMPTLMKAVGKGLREFRKATRDLRQATGIDELFTEEELRDPLGLRSPPRRAAPPSRDFQLTDADRRREYPPEGVDIVETTMGAQPKLALPPAAEESALRVDAAVAGGAPPEDD